MNTHPPCLPSDHRNQCLRGLYFLLLILGFIIASTLRGEAKSLNAEQVAVIYNSNIRESRELAEAYAQARHIPENQVLGIDCSDAEDIDRANFALTIKNIVLAEGKVREWWSFSGRTLTDRRVYALAVMKGVPLKVREVPRPKEEPSKKGNTKESQTNQAGPQQLTDAAAVDSELATLLLPDIDSVPKYGPIRNFYYESTAPFPETGMPVLLVSRIDALHWETCHTLIQDSLEAEKKGLRGWSVIDTGGPYKQGNDWLEAIVKLNDERGLPTFVDTYSQTLAKNYPLPEPVALYYGWYTQTINGPFLNPGFRFERGAIAFHIHSFSASTLRKPLSGWTSPLIEQGAAASVGNVYEPFLETSHHCDIFHNRLMEGFTLVEAAFMSVPCLSWQNIVIGDPLYRPFPKGKKPTPKTSRDKAFDAWKPALSEWKNQPDTLVSNIKQAAERTQLTTLSEAAAYYFMREKQWDRAEDLLTHALPIASNDRDTLRLELAKADILRRQNKKDASLALLDSLLIRYPSLPESDTLREWIAILRPPPPPEPKPGSNGDKANNQGKPASKP